MIGRRVEYVLTHWVVPTMLIVLIPVGVTIYLLDQQRVDSCKATLVALQGVRDTAQAGLREELPLSALEAFEGVQLKFAVKQREQTIEENARRRAVMDRMDQAMFDLRASDFCQ